jgi:ribonuclease P protein component
VFAGGRRLSGSHFLLLAAPRADADTARLGMAIARRYARTAVERNRIKRLVRESFRARRAALPPLDIVVMLRAGTAGVDSATLRAGLARLWDLLQGRDAL